MRLKQKLTRAQRNKRKANNQLNYENNKVRSEKKLLKSIDQIPLLLKKIEEKEKRNEKEKEMKNKLVINSMEENALTYDEAALIPLSDELKGSLRTILPKGCAIKDQVRTMRLHGDLMTQDRRNRRNIEKPHASKNIKWHAKYKYV